MGYLLPLLMTCWHITSSTYCELASIRLPHQQPAHTLPVLSSTIRRSQTRIVPSDEPVMMVSVSPSTDCARIQAIVSTAPVWPSNVAELSHYQKQYASAHAFVPLIPLDNTPCLQHWLSKSWLCNLRNQTLMQHLWSLLHGLKDGMRHCNVLKQDSQTYLFR